MLNWRKLILSIIYAACGNPTLRHLRYLRSVEKLPPEKLQQIQDEKLRQLLLHAARHVPYYADVLATAQVVDGDRVDLKHFHRIGVLTKEIIRAQGPDLHADDHKQRGSYIETSGGSTGEPIELIQDRNYKAWGEAHRLYTDALIGCDLGKSQIRLWGAERDIFQIAEKPSLRLLYWLFNATTLNSFRMSDEIMRRYAARWNRIRPASVLAYVASIDQFARYIKRTALPIHSPAAIISAAETLTEDVRTFVQDTFGCPVCNQYGSREVGAMACECPAGKGLHLYCLNNKIEILDADLCPSSPGQIGDVYVTNLHNYSMPLIRYQIGDTAQPAADSQCPCGRSWPLIASVAGRQSDHFRTRQGEIIHGEYFTHLFYLKPGIRRFQVIQRQYDHVEILLVPDGSLQPSDCDDITRKIRLVLGEQCRITFTAVDDIPTTPTGKHRYTISEIQPA